MVHRGERLDSLVSVAFSGPGSPVGLLVKASRPPILYGINNHTIELNIEGLKSVHTHED